MAKRTIIAVGEGQRREYEANSTVKPGMLIQVRSDGKCEAYATADTPNASKTIAIENEIFGKPVSRGTSTAGDYASGDRVLAEACGAGMEVNLIVKGTAAAISIGSPITSAGDGTVKVGTVAQAIGYSEEALDISGQATSYFDHVRVRLI